MKRSAVIALNGQVDNLSQFIEHAQQTNYLIAVDGGYRHFQKISKNPNILIGDLDSINRLQLKHAKITGITIKKYSIHKDQTDLELALDHVLNQELKDIIVFGAWGNRWDHSIANLLLASQNKYQTLNIKFIDRNQEAFIISGNKKLKAQIGQTISFIPITPIVKIGESSGLKYPLSNQIFKFTSPQTISNIAVATNPKINIKSGKFICVIQTGLKTGLDHNLLYSANVNRR